ncbi:MAG: single-stranded DNA-binding protein [Clostridia bacterium]|nr:single-stranded DNA-binding protein [Clostridia bacterium]
MNKVFLIGNLTRDPELRETPSGVAMCRFAIAVNRNYSSGDGERQTDFFECTAWRGMAETIARYTKKGKKISIVGSIQLRNYEDNQGVKRTAVDIVVQDFEFLSPRDENDSFDDVADAPRASAKKKPTLQAMDDDSDIPF